MSNTTTRTLRVPDPLWARVCATAEADGVTPSQLVRAVLDAALPRHAPEVPLPARGALREQDAARAERWSAKQVTA